MAVEPLTPEKLTEIMQETWNSVPRHPVGEPICLNETEQALLDEHGLVHVLWDDGTESILMTKETWALKVGLLEALEE